MALALATFIPAGCDDSGNPFAVSLQPFYTKADLETDNRLPGAWIDKDEDVTFTFERGEENEYLVTVKEREGGQELSSEFEAHLVRLGATWFLDFFPKSIREGDEFYRIHFLRAHSLARVEIREDSVRMAFLNGSWLRKKIEGNAVDTPHEKVDGSLLLTGTTDEVQKLAFFFGNDDEAFADPLSLERQRAEEVEQ
jgi:hypothetical protein